MEDHEIENNFLQDSPKLRAAISLDLKHSFKEESECKVRN
jgi:hypothetical protein